jgi:hypothetical protein
MEPGSVDVEPKTGLGRTLFNADPYAADKLRAGMAHKSSHELELLKSIVAAGESSLRTLLLINGGAAVATLAFLGNVLTKDPAKGVTLTVGHFTAGLKWYAAGVAMVGLGAVFRFLSLWNARACHPRIELSCAVLALASAFVSLSAFVFGCQWVAGGMY